MHYFLSKLDNNLRVLTVPMPSSESLTVTVWVKAGSRQEEERISGLAHFLEHMAFKGSSKFQTAREISEIVDGMGAINNAGTSKEWTNFWIKTAKDNLESAMEILSDIVTNPLLDPTEIGRERGVVYEEIAMYEDTPMMDIGEFFEENIFKGSKLGRRISGSRESLKSVNRDEFIEFRKRFYHPQNMLLSIAGGVSEKKSSELALKYFSDIKTTKSDEVEKIESGVGRRVAAEAGDRFTLKSKKSDQAHMMFGFKTEGRGYKGRFAQAVLATILGRGMSSRLWLQVRERRGLAYSVRASQERYSDIGHFSIYAGVTVDKVEEAIKVIRDEIFSLKDKTNPVADKEILKAKNNLKGHLALSLEDTSEVGDFFAEQVLFDNEILTPKDIFEGIEKVTIDDVNFEAEKIFNSSDIYLSIIGPYDNREKFVKVIK